MHILSKTGRIFFAIAMAEIGLQTVYLRDVAYMMLPPNHNIPGFAIIAIVFGLLITAASVCIVIEKKAREAALLMGGVLLLIFLLYFVPYQFIVSPNYKHLGDWENAEKELSLAGGALAVAACFPAKDKNPLFAFLAKLIPIGGILFAIPIVSFGILHFMYGNDVSSMVPSWIPFHLFWIYFAGTALIGSGMSIILKIKTNLFAALLGLMVLIWFLIIHVPDLFTCKAADFPDYMTSAITALAYSGAAFVIAGNAKQQRG